MNIEQRACVRKIKLRLGHIVGLIHADESHKCAVKCIQNYKEPREKVMTPAMPGSCDSNISGHGTGLISIIKETLVDYLLPHTLN